MLVFRKISDIQPVVDYIAQNLQRHLAAGEKVVWLLPGGSAIETAAAVSERLSGTDLQNLTVSLSDERYGPVGHADSNWQQLQTAGLSLPGAHLLPVLTGQDITLTAQAWQAGLQQALDVSDYRLAFLGIGPDGHTAGILPNSPAVAATDLVAVYDDGQYQRITTTPTALTRFDEAVVLARGEARREALQNLQADKPLAEQPAQLLKSLPRCIIFNDVIGEQS